MRTCPECGSKSYEKVGVYIKCIGCGYILGRAKIPNPKRVPKDEEPLRYGKGGAWVDKSLPTPDGIVMIDKRGVQYRVQSGRKRTGEWRNCIDCGKPIYVRTHRLANPNFGKRCTSCNRKAYLPPVRVKGGENEVP